MTRVDFYILDDSDETRRQSLVCRLVEKAWRLGNRIWIHASDDGHASTLDDLLWTFSQGSFIPHERADGEWDRACPVIIGDTPPADDIRHLLVNESTQVPDFCAHFERIAEVVNQSDAVRQAGRSRYTRYRDHGYDLHHHRMS